MITRLSRARALARIARTLEGYADATPYGGGPDASGLRGVARSVAALAEGDEDLEALADEMVRASRDTWTARDLVAWADRARGLVPAAASGAVR